MTLWWQSGIVYQIYPRSFADTTGNGVGDLQGIISKLDYIQSLNVDIIWLCPIYPSPQVDFGYDVADYRDINPDYGTMEDFDRLIEEAHDRDMYLVMDFVPNHTSDQHPWFQESRKTRDNPYRDWYIWKDPKADGSPPNNWEGRFGNRAWTFDETTGQYYMHQFFAEQPELNYENPEVLEAILDHMRFWYDRGVDGLRIDTAPLMKKHQQFLDEPIREDYVESEESPPWEKYDWIYLEDVEGIHEILKEFRRVTDEYKDRMMIGEIYYEPERLLPYYGIEEPEVHLPTNMMLINTEFDLTKLRPKILEYYELLAAPEYKGAWPNWQFGNHDRLRMASRIPDQIRLAFLLLFTLKGTPFSYYGDEIGIKDGEIKDEDSKDPLAHFGGIGGQMHNRDKCRTPMQWDDSEYAGFSTVEPWLPVHSTYPEFNVDRMDEDPNSLLNYFRNLTAFRQETPAMMTGDIEFDEGFDNPLFVYTRSLSDHSPTYTAILNFSKEPQDLDLEDISGKIVFATRSRLQGQIISGDLSLSGSTGLIIESQ